MLITIDKSHLKDAVEFVKVALSKVIIQEERSHLLCRVYQEEMKVTATNNDFKASATLPVTNESKTEFAFTIDPKVIDKLLGKIGYDNIRIDFDQKEWVVKLYTTEKTESFSSLQSFPAERMLTFDDLVQNNRKDYLINKQVLEFSLNCLKNFLAPIKEEQKQFDFIKIDKGIAFAANGSNKMGFLVLKAFSKFDDFKIRKVAVPFFIAATEVVGEEDLKVFETDRDIGIESLDGKFYCACLKSNIQTLDLPKAYLTSKGPYTIIDKKALIKVLDRIAVVSMSVNVKVLQMTLNGSGEDAYIDVSSIINLKSTERIPCKRFDESTEPITHCVDYKMFRTILTSFDSNDDVKFYINEDGKSYKICCVNKLGAFEYGLVAVGAYSRIIKK